jgi:hypothetical protein
MTISPGQAQSGNEEEAGRMKKAGMSTIRGRRIKINRMSLCDQGISAAPSLIPRS